MTHFMNIDISKIVPNPHRNFELDPISETAVARLMASHERNEQMGAIDVRPNPKGDGTFQQAAGHHNVEAMRRLGHNLVDVKILDLNDEDMATRLADENLTQRQNNAGAMADAVFARCRIIMLRAIAGLRDSAQARLTDQGNLAKLFKEGPGRAAIYEEMNGFKSKDKKVATEEQGMREVISLNNVAATVSSLKATGQMDVLLAEMREIRDAAQRAQEEAQKAEAERKAREAEEALKAAERAAREAEERAKREAEAAKAKAEKDAKAKAEAERKAKAAEKAKAERQAKEAALAKQRKAEAEAKAKRDKAEREAEEKRMEEALKAERQAKLNAVYDIRCVSVFELASQEQAFRQVITEPGAQRFIPKEMQVEVAKEIRKRIDETKKKRGHDVGSTTVRQFVNDILATAMQMQRDIDAEEKALLLKQQARMRIDERWKSLVRGLQQAEGALGKISEEAEAWSYDAPFPVNVPALNKLRGLSTRVEALRKKIGGF